MTNEEVVLNNIKLLMNAKGWSLRTLAAQSGMSPGNLSKVLQGSVKLSLPAAIKIAEAMDVDLQNKLLKGVKTYSTEGSVSKKYSIGIVSINNRRLTTVLDHKGNKINQSVLSRGLDLVDESTDLIQLIQESINDAWSKVNKSVLTFNMSEMKLNLVMQSYEFEEKRKKFLMLAHKYFNDVIILPDWIITLLAAFDGKEGISLVIDKGVSLSYLYDTYVKKIGGWKYPVYDLGGENWLGVETIKHAIEAIEGYVPMSDLANNVLSKFNGKIEHITETCHLSNDADIYCMFSEILLRAYYTGEAMAQQIIEKGADHIKRMINLADKRTGCQLPITLNGSLARLYKPYLDSARIFEVAPTKNLSELLAEIDEEKLSLYHFS
ncbi:helix-turn-helix domain-containing protein [Thiotrichales bacterium 19X7-9]|nr:helix-turn-helix domain-containing protein [Thiotrichales bacterium 19X7-9]